MMKQVRIVLGMALVALAVTGCSKGFAEPELAVKKIGELRKDRAPAQLKRAVQRMKWRIECDEKEMEWFADKGAKRKELDEAKAQLEFLEDNLGKIEDSLVFEVTDIKQPDPNNQNLKEVAIKVWSYDLRPGVTPKDFYLEYRAGDQALKFTKTDKGWKLQKGTVKLDELD